MPHSLSPWPIPHMRPTTEQGDTNCNRLWSGSERWRKRLSKDGFPRSVNKAMERCYSPPPTLRIQTCTPWAHQHLKASHEEKQTKQMQSCTISHRVLTHLSAFSLHACPDIQERLGFEKVGRFLQARSITYLLHPLAQAVRIPAMPSHSEGKWEEI